jgi:hypothetical protein
VRGWPRRARSRCATSAATRCTTCASCATRRGRRDDEHRAEDALQKLTDEKVKELDALVKAKEEEILEV